MIKKVINKVKQNVIFLNIHRDERGGSGLEESGSFLFILVPILAGLATIGALIPQVFTKVINAITAGLGMP